MRFLQRFGQQCMQVWLGMSMGRRVGFTLMAALCLASVVGVGYWASQPDYRVLYSGLSMEDAGAITAKLQTQGVAFHLTANGTTVMVPVDQVQQLRLDLAVEGLPAKSGKGFEMLDGNSLGMTPFMQHVNYSRALQAELAKTIMQIEPISYARVHLVQPESSPFIREKKPTTASVVLKLKAGAALNRSTAAGIAALVARSVEGLAPDQVTLLDTTGRVLLDQHGGETGAIPTTQLEYKREYEAYLASKAEEILTQVVGPGRAIVRVTADIDFKSLTETKESYDLGQKAIKKETVQSHTSTGAGSAARGPAGTASNLTKAGSAPAPATPQGSKDSEETSDTEYYSPPKTVQQRVEASGGVERLTIAVMVDRESVPNLSLSDIQDLTKQAVGFKMGRDEIKATDTKLVTSAALADIDAEMQENQRWQKYMSVAHSASLGVAAVVGLIVLGVGWLILRRRLRGAGEAKPTPGLVQGEQARTLETLSAQAQQDPESLARLLSAWLEENEAPAGRLAA